ncbi:hypothetical protein LTR60_003185, partial [Cryomyces antarcticus]
MKFTSILPLLLSIGVASALPRLVVRDDDPCYCVDYDNDDNGNKYGGSYDLCSTSFEAAWPKPVYGASDSCWKTEYDNDDCGHQYGG